MKVLTPPRPLRREWGSASFPKGRDYFGIDLFWGEKGVVGKLRLKVWGGRGEILRLKGAGGVPRRKKLRGNGVGGGGMGTSGQFRSRNFHFTQPLHYIFFFLSHKTKCPFGCSPVINDHHQKPKQRPSPAQQLGQNSKRGRSPLSTSGSFGFVSCKRSTHFAFFFQAPSSKGRKRGHKQRLHPPRCRDQSRSLSKDKMNVYIVRKRD